ncbi:MULTISPECIES: Gfo/Idh/MocA family oxidoreductase [unclassified Novosphingobium]|uniref:Gfo/Idh/MocA family protein n=1 Tax=unclassified Novosphingobium TaxID=2644732 RepID=UPI00146E7260|nr:MULTISPECIES: Gfo/Idh/MocA family oxidoreductase [unclassified Novosphingobium]NMN05429.1 putative dehydrogenase [Novosphingobium sp. SG919]NMN87724.1 putative dehydrogenase [Novosphingobium sp. SG916]
MARRIRMGLIGGGPGSFIGPVHAMAARLDGQIDLVAGVFSRDAARNALAAAGYGVDPARAYANVEALLAQEAQRPDGIDFVTIATPNAHHAAAATAAIDAGVAVLSDKPMTATLAEAQQIVARLAHNPVPFGLTYTYTGYPLVREMRARVAAGAIGTLRKVVVEYSQGWLAGAAESGQAQWRLDPARSGEGGCIADIGVHAFHLAEFIGGTPVVRLAADLGSVVHGRALDDDCQVFLRFANGARGLLMASQVMTGEGNGLAIRLYGSTGGLRWSQEEPNHFDWLREDGGLERVRAGDPSLGAAARRATRLPGGHPEGLIEALGNLYRDFAGSLAGEPGSLVPDAGQGLRGMAFIAASVAASRAGAGWVDFAP